MLHKRRASRGNVAIAALVFVTFVGVAAVAFDSARIAQDPQAQLAQGIMAPGTTKAPDGSIAKSSGVTIKGKCEIGYDYEVREVGGMPEVKPRGTSQCLKIDAQTPYKDPEGKVRYCTKDGWRCRYYYCKIDELRIKNKAGKPADSECILMGSFGKPNEEANLTSDRTQALKDAIERKSLDPNLTKEEARVLAPLAQALDGNVQASLLNSLDPSLQQKKLEELQKEHSQAKDNLISCLAMAVPGGCDGQAQAEVEAKQKVDEQKQRLELLAKNSQSLGGMKETLKAESPPVFSGDCITGNGAGCFQYPQTEADKTRFEKEGYVCDRASTGVGFACYREAGYKKPPPENNCTFGSCKPGQPDPTRDPRNPNNGISGSAGNLLKSLGQFAPLLGSLFNGLSQNQNAPSCTLTASPTSITRAGQPVTISWRSQNAQSAYLSNAGQVGPSGSITVNPQQTTTYTMQVTGYPQQQQQQTQQPQGQFVYNPYTGQYQFVQSQQQPVAQGAPQQGQCQVQVVLGSDTGGGGGTTEDKPVAQISCQPKIADVGMTVSISYACQNGATASKGEGFATDNKLSGSASTTVTAPGLGSTSQTYGITCTKAGVTDSAQCTVGVNKPSIVLVANPKDIDDGDRTNIGWVTGAMEKCVISSPTLSEFTEDNKDNTNVSGSVKTPPLTRDTKFVLTCTTKAGGTKTAETTVDVD